MCPQQTDNLEESPGSTVPPAPQRVQHSTKRVRRFRQRQKRAGKVRVEVSLGEAAVAELEAWAMKSGMKRSAFASYAVQWLFNTGEVQAVSHDAVAAAASCPTNGKKVTCESVGAPGVQLCVQGDTRPGSMTVGGGE